MKPYYRKIHSRFKLNGNVFTYDDLKEVAYSLIKEGENFERPIGDFLTDWLTDCPTLQVQTSGSTGKPKSITLRKENMVNSALATGEFFNLSAGDSALLCLPADYIAGKMMLVRAMVLGLELDYVPASSNPLANASKTYEFCAMIPLQLENSLDVLDCIRTLIVGGAPLSHNVKKQLQVFAEQSALDDKRCLKKDESPKNNLQKFSTSVFETYGMTETITHVAAKRIVPVSPRNDANKFVALPEVFFSSDNRGCLMIDAPKIAASPVVTNDVVRLVSQTEFEWMGRYDNVINSGGVKLFPEQIEAKLTSVISLNYFVAGFPDEKLGQKLVLFIEGNTDKKKLLQKIRSLKGIGKFEVPKEIHSCPKFEMTDNSKIQRSKTLASMSLN